MRRARTAGRHIGPGDGNEYVQIVDVKDVASLLVLAVEQGIVGDFNLTGRAMTFREFLQRCKSVTRSDAEFVWVPKDFLLDSAAAENDKYFPLWRPNPRVRAIFQTSSEKAFRAGWEVRPFAETAFDCLSFFNSLNPAIHSWADPLTPEAEAHILKRWEAERAKDTP